MRDFFIAMTRNGLSLLGVAVTTASATLILALFSLGLFGYEGTPYIGILAYLIFPALFVGGLFLIPCGIMIERRRIRRAAEHGEAPPAFPVVDLNRPSIRKRVVLVLALSMINIVILATATIKGVEVMDSTAFCGTTCHTVMQPEHTAHQRSPHSRVSCVDCHIGPGTDWFVKSKLSGAWQVVAVTFDLYPRPIPTPVHDLRPARETCEQCHWPTKFVGDKLKVITHHADDEANTPLKTVLLLRVGGLQGRRSQGIHWHVDPGVRIRYRADASRQTISEVELQLADGTERLYTRAGAAAATGLEDWRVMDCIDCHNRPTHIYSMPGDEIDRALEDGRLPRDLPYLKREATRILEQDYPSHDAARQGIATALSDYYRQSHPALADTEASRIAAAATELGQLYCANVFPTMSVKWGTYPNHLGHEAFPGCFRCHDDEHRTTDGATISQDCPTCHTLLAMGEEQPEILTQLEP